MMLTTVILQRDLWSWPRRRWFYSRRAGFIALSGAMVLWGSLMGAAGQTTTMGLQMFRSLTSVVLFTTCAVSALIAGLTLFQEKRERTLGLLLLTDVTAGAHIGGKFLSCFSATLLTVLSAFPMFVLTASLGGVSAMQIAAAFLVILGAMFMGSAAGLFSAVVSGTERALMGLIFAIGLLVFGGLPACWGLARLFWPTLPEESLFVISSFAMVVSLGAGGAVLPAVWNLAFHLLLGLPFLFLATVLLPKRFSAQDVRSTGWSIRQLCDRKRRGGRSRRPWRRANPVTWKDVCFVYGGDRHEWMLCGVTAAVVGVLTALVVLCIEGDLAAVFFVTFGLLAGLGAAVFAFGAVVRAARTFNTEKLNGTMDMLLVTDLTDREIIHGKLKAIARSVRPWFVLGLVSGALLAMGTEEPYALLFVLGGGSWLIGTAFAFACLAMMLSIRMRTPAVLGCCLVAYLAWNWIGKSVISMVGMMIFMGIGAAMSQAVGEWALVVFGVISAAFYVAIDVGLGLVLLVELRSHFRAKAIRPL